MANISKQQIKIIHTLKPRIAGLSERDAYLAFLSNAVGRMVESCTDLNRDEATKVTQMMLRMAGEAIGARYQVLGIGKSKNSKMAALAGKARGTHIRPAVPTMVTQEQLNLVQRAAELRGWDQGTLNAFIQRQTKHTRILTKWDFERVFWALKRMNDHDGIYRRDAIAN
jgi:hypothetical protein